MNQRHRTISAMVTKALEDYVQNKPIYTIFGNLITKEMIYNSYEALEREIRRYNIIMAKRSINTRKQIEDFVKTL